MTRSANSVRSRESSGSGSISYTSSAAAAIIPSSRHFSRGIKGVNAPRDTLTNNAPGLIKCMTASSSGSVPGARMRTRSVRGGAIITLQSDWEKTSSRLASRDEVFSQSDCIVIMAPPRTERVRILAPGTEPELDAVMHLIKPGALLVNVSRGALTPFIPLEKCLEEGIIAAAALDVYEIEPLPLDSRLRTEFAERVIFGAHSAYNCQGITEKVTHLTFKALFEELGCPFPWGDHA